MFNEHIVSNVLLLSESHRKYEKQAKFVEAQPEGGCVTLLEGLVTRRI